MIKDIDSIFKAITPENIKDVPVIKDAMDIFIETLKELSKESIDIRNAFENENIKEQLVKTYLDDLYNVLQQVQLNEKLIETIDRVNSYYGDDSYLSKDAIINVSQYINTEHFLTFKSYKQNKGSEKAIEYIYELVNSLVTVNTINNENTGFRFNETNIPFHLDMEGSLPAEFYEYIVYPLAHPLGFTFTYLQYLDLSMIDYFPELDITYDTNRLEVRCLSPDSSTSVEKYIDNSVTRQEQIDAGLNPDLEVIDFKNTTESGVRIKEVYLNDGTYLKQETSNLGQSVVFLYNTDTNVLIKEYTDQCSIYFDYSFVTNTTVTDILEPVVKPNSYGYWSRLDYRADLDMSVGSFPDSNYSGYEEQSISSFHIGAVNSNNVPYSIGDEEAAENAQRGSFINSYHTINNFRIGTVTVKNKPNNIGETHLHRMDAGWNYYLDNNGNYLINPSSTLGRFEHFHAPDWESDLKILEGKFVYNYNIENESNVVIYTQPLKYTDTVEQTPVVSRVNTVPIYRQQNIGNLEHAAREHEFFDATYYNENNEYYQSEASQKAENDESHLSTVGNNYENGTSQKFGDGLVVGSLDNEEFFLLQIGGNYYEEPRKTIGGSRIGEDYPDADRRILGSYIYNESTKKIGDPVMIGNPSNAKESINTDGIQYYKLTVQAETFNLQFNTNEDFDCGVYRDGTRLEDNNIGAI